ncbi:hypothetical protein [Nostoc sp. CHAB 5715]|uniref:hypothetical protein n=1 Tax=Nostoc sp. CHAB 5715 TaxID=2780400 RepID=UPI001E5A6F6A|nr:hypothetical protein [Nostoc sp. CHAB 5715]MCC5623968.1 hypothetical protein [Nostoc sp. CHAB 5715]
MPKPESYLPDSATKAITSNNGWHTQITGRVRWRSHDYTLPMNCNRASPLQNDSVKVIIWMTRSLGRGESR